MPIKFRCPNCRQFLGISRAKAGTLSDCPTCGRTLRIPALDGSLAPVPAPKLNLEDSELREALGALACLNEEGQAAEMEYSVLTESRYQPRDDSSLLLPNVSNFLEQYFEHPSRVLGQIQHVYREINVTSDEEASLDYKFEKR